MLLKVQYDIYGISRLLMKFIYQTKQVLTILADIFPSLEIF